MKRKIWASAIAVIVAAGGMLLFKEIPVLELRNTDRSQTVQVRIAPSERFSISYIHSIYHEPVTEEFETGRDGIALQGVRTKSSAVQEYYRFEESKEFHRIHVNLGAFFLRVGEGEGQTLRVGGHRIYFSHIGGRGDRIRLSVRSVSLGHYLLAKLTRPLQK